MQNEQPKDEKIPVSGPMRYIFIAAGILSLAIGTIGVVLPFLPSTPFFLLTVVCFAKGSQKLHDWFLSTKLYRKHLESFVKKRAMTWKSKAYVICSVTLLMSVGFIMMRHVPAGQIVLAAVWLFHVLYFLFRVKTAAHDNSSENDI